jgi:hypothetical protein
MLRYGAIRGLRIDWPFKNFSFTGLILGFIYLIIISIIVLIPEGVRWASDSD